MGVDWIKEEEKDEAFDEPGSAPGVLKDILRVVKCPYSLLSLNEDSRAQIRQFGPCEIDHFWSF